MNDWMIQPWGDVEGDIPTVPPELDAIAERVMEQYDMRVLQRTLITTKPDKGGAIWRIDTDKGPRSLKVLHRTPQRSLFSVGAQDYLVRQGARVPALIPTREGELHFEAGGKLWIVTDWIEPLAPVSKIDLEGAQALCYGLGEFHRISQGYTPPPGAQKASRLYGYPKQYRKILNKMDWFRVVATTYSDLPGAQRMLTMIDKYEQHARDALYSLEHSPYKSLTERGEPAWGIAHQDYGWSNGQMGPGGLWIIDLDGVAYDLPIRDLRKLITSTMDDMGVWDVTWMRGMIEAYHNANPIEPELYQVLLIDMALPNEFYKHVKEMVFEPELFFTPELDAMLERMEQTDATKWPALAELGATILQAPSSEKPSYAASAPPMLPAHEGNRRFAPQPSQLPVASALPSAAAALGGTSTSTKSSTSTGTLTSTPVRIGPSDRISNLGRTRTSHHVGSLGRINQPSPAETRRTLNMDELAARFPQLPLLREAALRQPQVPHLDNTPRLPARQRQRPVAARTRRSFHLPTLLPNNSAAPPRDLRSDLQRNNTQQSSNIHERARRMADQALAQLKPTSARTSTSPLMTSSPLSPELQTMLRKLAKKELK